MNYKVLITFFSLLILLFGCFNSNSKSYTTVLNDELTSVDSDGKIPFSTTLTHTPTIKYKLEKSELFFAVDTGSVINFLLGSKSVENLVQKEVYSIAKKIKKQNTLDIRINFGNEQFLLDPNGVFSSGMKTNPYDGFLGLTYLEQFRNVVFDYVNKTISFNEEPICDNSLPMYKRDYVWFTTFECNGVKSNAMVDTGCFSVFINKPNVKATVGDDEIINVRLGNVECNGISILQNKTLVTNENAKNGMYKNENIIGYPCFKDHVIQLDFEHNTFRIK